MIPTDMARDPTASAPARHQRERRDWRIAYDADCGFCRWSLALVLRLDRAACLAPVELGAESTDLLLADLTPEQRAASWHLISPDGDRWSAGAAAPPLLRLLPGGRAPAAVLAAAPRATERAYRWVADHRSTLGKLIPEAAKRWADEVIGSRTGIGRPR